MTTYHSKLKKKYLLVYTGETAGTNQRHMVSKGKIILTKKYRDFKKALINTWYNPKLKTVTKNIHLDILMLINKKRDSDSLLKPIFDALEGAKIIKNDNQIMSYYVEKRIRKSNQDTIIVYLYEVNQ